MSVSIEQLESIEWKVQKLVQKMKLLKKENAQLLEENVQLSNDIKKIKDNKGNLEANFSRTKEALDQNKQEEFGNNKMLKEEIDHYISEIDKCIIWLQSI